MIGDVLQAMGWMWLFILVFLVPLAIVTMVFGRNRRAARSFSAPAAVIQYGMYGLAAMHLLAGLALAIGMSSDRIAVLVVSVLIAGFYCACANSARITKWIPGSTWPDPAAS